MEQSRRLLSLDTLRGFDMLFIMGFAGLVSAVCAIFPSGVTDALSQTMGHAEWHGFTHHDTIFPLFLFIAGISFPFSLAKQRAAGHSTGAIYRKIITRGVVLVLLGIIYNGLFKLDFENLRYASVLGRIGIAWACAAVLFLNFRTSTRIGIAVAILLGYWALLRYAIAPDALAGAGSLSYEGNIVGYIDRIALPGRLCYDGFDPEGLVSTIPAIVTAMLGMLTGEFVRRPEQSISGSRKALYMFLAAIALAVVGSLWNEVLPVNKKLWTSSFVCVVAAYSLGMFAIFYYIIDVKGYKRWTLFFKVIGLNSITIYLAQRIIDFKKIGLFFVGGAVDLCPEDWGTVISRTAYVAVCWIFLYFLYKKNTFLKV